MSDGITESHRYMRKETYLNEIELTRDRLFDQYMELTRELLDLTDLLIGVNNSFSFMKRKTIKKYEKDLIILRTKLNETHKLINKLDVEHQDADKRPLKSFV